MRDMRESGVEWIDEIPSSWKIVPLKSLFSFGKGLPITKENLEESGIPVISYGQIHAKWNSGVTTHKELLRFVNESYLETNPQSLVRRGDLIMADTSEDREGCGNCAYIDTEDTLFAGYHTIILHSLSETDNKYLAYLFLTDSWRSQIRKAVSGVKLFSVSRRILGSVSVLVPDKPDQIVAFLDKKCAQVDTLIANVQAQIEKLKAYKQSLITEVVTKGLDPTVPMKDTGVEWLGMVPEKWAVHRIANLYSERSENGHADLPILTVSIHTGVSDYEVSDADKDRVFIRMEDRSKYKRVCPGDLTYNMMRAWQGAFGAVRVEGMVSPAYVVAKPKNPAQTDSRYIEALLRTPSAIEEMHRYSRGIVDFRLRLYWPEFRSIHICLPPIEEQTQIADYIDEKSKQIDKLIAIKHKKIDKLNEYKKSLIYEYVTGKRAVV